MEKKKKIYIMMSQTGTRFSKCLKIWSKYPYNHISIALDRDLQHLYSFGRRNLYIPLFAGFLQENIKGGLYQMYNDTRCRVYELDVTEEAYNEISDIIYNFDREGDKYKYSMLGMLAMLLNIPWERRYHFVCSQFVAYVLTQSHTLDLDKNYLLVRPSDFDILPKENLIYTGRLCEYH